MKKIKILTFAFVLFGTASFAQPADSVLSKFIKATGGQELYDGIESYSITLKSEDAKVPYEQTLTVAEKDAKVLKVRSVMGRKFLYKLESNNGTLYIPSGGLNRANTYQTQNLSDFEKSKLVEDLQSGVFAFINYSKKGYSIKSKGNLKLGTINATQVEVTAKDVTRNYFFDQATFLLLKEDVIYANGDKVEMVYSAYKVNDYGVKYPSKGSFIESGKSKTVDIELSINNVKPDVFEIK